MEREVEWKTDIPLRTWAEGGRGNGGIGKVGKRRDAGGFGVEAFTEVCYSFSHRLLVGLELQFRQQHTLRLIYQFGLRGEAGKRQENQGVIKDY